MPKDKQFDVELARERATHLFWANGFEATSMEDLLRSMGISRGSFYDTFGSKRELYTDALRRYDERFRRDVLRRFGTESTPKRAIVALFEAVRDEATASKGGRGCFLANAASELACSDKTVAKVTRAAFAETEQFFATMIRAGQRSGEIRRELQPDPTASVLLGLLLGMRVLARSGAATESLDAIVSQIPEIL